MSEAIRVLLVDDEESFRKPMMERLAKKGFQVEEAASGPEALAKARECGGEYQVAVIDQVMGPPNGTETMRQLRRLYPVIETIILTGWGDMEPGEKAMEMGAYRYMSKPISNVEELVLNIRTAFRLGRERQHRLALEALVRAGQRISDIQSEEELYQCIYEQAQALLPGLDSFLVSLWDEPNQTASFPFYQLRGERQPSYQRQGHRGITELVIQSEKPLQLLEGDEAYRREHGLQPPQIVGNCTSQIIVPMFLRGEVVGTIHAWTYDPDVHYAQEHLGVLQAFANQVATTIQSVRQLKEATQLANAATALASQRGKKAVLRTIVGEAHKLINSDFTGLILQDEDGTLHKIQPVIPKDFFERFEEPRQQGGVTRAVAEAREPRIISDTEKDPLVKDSVRAAGIRSMLVMPLIYGDRVLGVLYGHTSELRYFSPQDVNLWSTFAAQAAVALHSALEEETSEIWKNLDREIAACNDLKAIYRLFAEHALCALHADFAVFYPYDTAAPPEEHRFILQDCVQVGNPQTSLQPPRGGLGGGVHKALEAEDGLLIVNDLESAGGQLRSHLSEREGVNAFIALRLEVVPDGHVQPKIAGILFLNFRKSTRFEPADLVGLRLAGNRVASAIQRLHLLAALQEERQQLNRRLRAVVDIVQVFREHQNGHLILKRIAEATKAALGIDVCTLLEYDQEKGKLSKRGAAGLIAPAARYKLPKEFSPRFLDKTGPIIIPDVQQDKRMRNRKFVRREGIQSTVVYPLRVEGETLGLLFADYRYHKEPTPDELEAIRLFADLNALMMHQARLREELGRTQRRLERRLFLDWVSMVEASWRHSLVNKAATILNYTATLQNRLAQCSQSPAAMAGVPETIKEIDRLAKEIASAPPRVPQSWEMEAELIPLAPLLEEVAQREGRPSLLQPGPLVEIRADVEALGGVQVLGHRRWLIYALEALLQNARNAMPQGGTVSISGGRAGGWAEVRIRDRGSGVPEAIRGKLFKDLTSREQDKVGIGLGCLLAATIVEDHEGSIELETPGPGDTTVLLRLPVAKETER
jgi:two-component system OmpR family response regulator